MSLLSTIFLILHNISRVKYKHTICNKEDMSSVHPCILFHETVKKTFIFAPAITYKVQLFLYQRRISTIKSKINCSILISFMPGTEPNWNKPMTRIWIQNWCIRIQEVLHRIWKVSQRIRKVTQYHVYTIIGVNHIYIHIVIHSCRT